MVGPGRTQKRPVVVHGFRATFRTWAEEQAKLPAAVIEDAMGHAVGSRVERAYRRTDMLKARRDLMTAWAGLVRAAQFKQYSTISEWSLIGGRFLLAA